MTKSTLATTDPNKIGATPKRRNQSDIVVSFAHFTARKSSRDAAKEMTAAGGVISHNTVAALTRGDRLPCASSHGPILWRLGGMMPPGTEADRTRRDDALLLAGYAPGNISDSRVRELVGDVLSLLPHALSGARLPPGRRLNLGVTTLLLRDRVAGADSKLRDRLGVEFLKVHDLDSDEGRKRVRSQTLKLAEELCSGLINEADESFLSGDPDTKQAEINGVRYLKNALLENLFGAHLAFIHDQPSAVQLAAMAEAAADIVRAGYVEAAAEIDHATNGWACWKLGNAFHISTLAGDYLRTIEAARNLAGRFPNFHRARYGRENTAKAAYEDPKVWIGLAVIRRLNFDRVGPLKAVCDWIDAPASDPEHKRCLDAVRCLLAPEGLKRPPEIYVPDHTEYPRLMTLIDPFINGATR